MARPKVNRTSVTMNLRTEALLALDARAKARGLNRTQYIEAVALGHGANSHLAPAPTSGKNSYDPVLKTGKR